MRTKLLALAAAAIAALATAPAVAAQEPTGFSVEWGSLTGKSNGNGTFRPANRPAAASLMRSGAMEAVVDEVNRRWTLPTGVPILFSDLIQAGPAYFPRLTLDDGTRFSLINVPGSFLTLEVAELRPHVRGIDGFTARDAMVAANQFVVAHEIGHAMVDQLKLPVTGREEDAVDGFAAYLLADNPRFGPLTALSAAMFFAAHTEIRGELKDTDFADEHSILEQRVYQFLCWTYGSDKRQFRSLIGRNGLPRSRAVRCGAEWKQVNRSWDALLAPYATGVGR